MRMKLLAHVVEHVRVGQHLLLALIGQSCEEDIEHGDRRPVYPKVSPDDALLWHHHAGVARFTVPL
jgi:hypothetical protein